MANGHRLEDVWLYPIRTIMIFRDLIVSRQRKTLHDLTSAVRLSQASDQKVVQEFLRSLQPEED